jgi:hypothetical protein
MQEVALARFETQATERDARKGAGHGEPAVHRSAAMHLEGVRAD